MPRKPKTDASPAAKSEASPSAIAARPKPAGKLETLTGLLRRESGATLAELCAATGWQAHSVRGAISGALKKRGLEITSTKTDGERRYAAKSDADGQ
jgi:hypothetical protein